MAIPSWARVGAKVVCIDAGRIVGEDGCWHHPRGEISIAVVYTIRQVVARDESGPCIRLKEIKRGWWREGWRFYHDTPFLLARFRPAQQNGGKSEVEAAIFRNRKAAAPVTRIPHLGEVH